MKSGWDWLILVSTETVHFRPCRLHWTGLVTLTCSARFSLRRQQGKEESGRRGETRSPSLSPRRQAGRGVFGSGRILHQPQHGALSHAAAPSPAFGLG